MYGNSRWERSRFRFPRRAPIKPCCVVYEYDGYSSIWLMVYLPFICFKHSHLQYLVIAFFTVSWLPCTACMSRQNPADSCLIIIGYPVYKVIISKYILAVKFEGIVWCCWILLDNRPHLFHARELEGAGYYVPFNELGNANSKQIRRLKKRMCSLRYSCSCYEGWSRRASRSDGRDLDKVRSDIGGRGLMIIYDLRWSTNS